MHNDIIYEVDGVSTYGMDLDKVVSLIYDTVYAERYMLTPQMNEACFREASAITIAADRKCPLLIISGTADDNVHFYNTLKYASKLSSEGKIFDMMAYAGFEHSLGMCDARMQLFCKIVDFLRINL